MERNEAVQVLNEVLSRVVAVGLTLAVDLGTLAESIVDQLGEMGVDLVRAAASGEAQ